MAGVWFFEHWDMIVISILFMFICIEAHETRNNERLLLLALCFVYSLCEVLRSSSGNRNHKMGGAIVTTPICMAQ